MNVIQNLLTPNRYSRPQTPLNRITKIAIHWVGNPNSSAMQNRNYFESLKLGKTYKTKNNQTAYLYASSHYINGILGEIIQCVPDNEIAYCTNSANSYSISIENCHPDWTGQLTIATYDSLILLCANLCIKYELNPFTDLIRHYDVTKKDCPRYFVNNPSEWDILKQKVYDKIFEMKSKGSEEIMTNIESLIGRKEVIASALNVRNLASTNGSILGQLKNGDIVEVTAKIGDWLRITYNNRDAFIHGNFVKDYIEKIKCEECSQQKNKIKDLESEIQNLESKIYSAINILKGQGD
jgi:N-acetylmuramoyl-L-alanine amidase